MVRIFVVDNGGQWTHREWRTLRDLDVDTKILPNTAPFEEYVNNGVDGLVLSGGAPRVGLLKDLGNCREYLEKGNFPILGICAGHQFMASFYGGKVKPSITPEFGKVELQILSNNSLLFKDLPKKSIVWESHNDEVVELPSTFELLASSENCLIQAMQHKTKPLFGLQFHPEVKHTEFGEKIFSNFIKICEG
jgi:GMP synthase (glutamine-hydrolysing)